ncbi:MAG: glycosyltransferase [Akkermansiaceae bacterium]
MKKSLRLLKFDSVYPPEFLHRRQAEQRSRLAGLGYEEYYRWLMEQRFGLSDFLTYYMNEAGWSAREVLWVDDLLFAKLPVTYWPSFAARLREKVKQLASTSISELVTLKYRTRRNRLRRERQLENYIRSFKPDVLFIREPSHIKGQFWDRFRERCLLVACVGCNTLDPWEWNAHRYDVIFTLTDEYNDFFRAEGHESHLFSYGVDERVVKEVAGSAEKYDCAFVGYLGTPDQRAKTKLLERVAQNVDFKWWGVKGPELGEDSALRKTWQGSAAGIDMFRIYKEAKIVVNEYPEIAMGKNVNIRTMEVLNVGTFLLTRAASNIEWLEKAGALVTFNSEDDCLAKIKRFLADDSAREKIATQGQRTALEHFNYRDIAGRTMEIICAAWEKKRSKLKDWESR